MATLQNAFKKQTKHFQNKQKQTRHSARESQTRNTGAVTLEAEARAALGRGLTVGDSTGDFFEKQNLFQKQVDYHLVFKIQNFGPSQI